MMIVGCEWRQHWGVERKCVLAVAVAQCVRDAMFMLAALLTLLAASMDLNFGLASRHYEYLSSTCRGGDGVTGGSRFDEKNILRGALPSGVPYAYRHTLVRFTGYQLIN